MHLLILLYYYLALSFKTLMSETQIDPITDPIPPTIDIGEPRGPKWACCIRSTFVSLITIWYIIICIAPTGWNFAKVYERDMEWQLLCHDQNFTSYVNCYESFNSWNFQFVIFTVLGGVTIFELLLFPIQFFVCSGYCLHQTKTHQLYIDYIEATGFPYKQTCDCLKGDKYCCKCDCCSVRFDILPCIASNEEDYNKLTEDVLRKSFYIVLAQYVLTALYIIDSILSLTLSSNDNFSSVLFVAAVFRMFFILWIWAHYIQAKFS